MICKGAGVGEMLQVIRGDCARHILSCVVKQQQGSIATEIFSRLCIEI
uniref:Uncharacterized protein n=1 Tax=Setaria italica TaxID=4555 RepID=K3Z1X6_SETIT